MSKNSAIEIFLRVRPTKKPYNGLTIKSESNKVEIYIPKDEGKGYVNNQRESFEFEFDGVNGMDTKQDQIFDNVAKDVVDSAMEGFNGTIFAYGQTGSGKTFTMTGGAERYVDRGIIPRTLSYIFSESKKRTGYFYKVSVSYIEIYDDNGYDLLDENHTTKNLHDLPKVIPRESEDGRLLLSGLSVHKAESEEQALNLLFIGDTNRVVSETPKNDASTRSHCIFIIQLEATQAGSDVKTVSRLHLVDLSGSERVGKTGVEGILLQEARFINLSLHYLEHVIICLNKRAKGEDVHIPYRNSLMTMVLRDSLGGNCKTRMVATISAESPDIDESISTCRFAQRVALIKNSVQRNEAVDPALIIERLKKENAELRNELALLKGGSNKTSLDQDEIEECQKIVEEFINNPDPSAKIILKDMIKINECFYHFKHMYNNLAKKSKDDTDHKVTNKILKDGLKMDSKQPVASDADTLGLQDEIKRLKLLIQQRDNEIMILLNLINKNKAADQQSLVPVDSADAENKSMIISTVKDDRFKPMTFPSHNNVLEENKENVPIATPKRLQYEESNKPITMIQKGLRGETKYKYNSEISEVHSVDKKGDPMSSSGKSDTTAPSNGGNSKEVEEVQSMLFNPLNLTNEQLMDRASCFEMFRKSYRKNQAMEDNKELLKDKFNRGKELGAVVNDSRNEINRIKNQIESLRQERALQGLVNNENSVIKHPDEEKLNKEIERQKAIYKKNYEELKDLKAEIEQIQQLLERNRERMQKDFDKWLEVMLNQRSVVTGTNTPSLSTQKNFLSTTKNDLGNTRTDLNKSVTSQVTTTSHIENKTFDEGVKRNLAAFYKAREEIHKSISNN